MQPPPPPKSAFPWYLTSASLWMGGMTLQGFLFTWLLVGTLAVSAEHAGLARALAEFPPLLILLLGGILGDRVNGRRYLTLMHGLMALPPLGLIVVYVSGALSFGWVATFGVLMASIQALSDPARQSTLSRVARLDVQRAVTIMTIVTSLVGLGGFYLGGQLDRLGLTTLLVLEASIFASGMAATWRLPDLATPGPRAPVLGSGLPTLLALPLIRNVIALNFLSSLFNAGAYIVALPYVVREVYAGDAATFATVMTLFTAGSIGSNVVLLAFMPIARPGRLFLIMQVSRALILTLLWLEPAPWLFYVAVFAWGLNMGTTTTMVRTTVQELAPEPVRAQILSVLLLSFLISSPVSSLVLGFLIAGTTPLTALLPGVVISVVIFVLGARWSGLWSYRYDGSPLVMPGAPGSGR
ncbi:MAG: MFS transporter [Pseudomonadales bacterium]